MTTDTLIDFTTCANVLSVYWIHLISHGNRHNSFIFILKHPFNGTQKLLCIHIHADWLDLSKYLIDLCGFHWNLPKSQKLARRNISLISSIFLHSHTFVFYCAKYSIFYFCIATYPSHWSIGFRCECKISVASNTISSNLFSYCLLLLLLLNLLLLIYSTINHIHSEKCLDYSKLK